MSVMFFKENKIDDNASLVATSADTGLFSNLYDNDNVTRLLSSGSDDSTPEVWTITFASAKTFDSIHVALHNISSGNIQYDDGGYTDFSTPISWSSNTNTTDFFTFDSVTTTSIRLTLNTTQTVDAQKYIGELRCLETIGTVDRNPSKADPSFDEKSKKLTTDDNSSIYVFFGSKFQTKMKFNNASDDDLTLFRALKDQGTPFYVYMGGGDTNFTQEGYRVQDMYLVNYTNDFRYKLQKGHLTGIGVKIDLELKGAY